MPPAWSAIDLNDKDAWDDSALLKAYDAAVGSYQVARLPDICPALHASAEL